jgi:glycosyltransferase involved in cell wall biosynthesis
VVLLPGEEDFGIVPLEAQACGRPVVAYARGGALETVVRGETGFLVEDATAAAFADAIRLAMDHPFDSRAIRDHAERFGRGRFDEQIGAIIRETLSAREAGAAGTAPW